MSTTGDNCEMETVYIMAGATVALAVGCGIYEWRSGSFLRGRPYLPGDVAGQRRGQDPYTAGEIERSADAFRCHWH